MSFTVISTFSGCGGSSLGYTLAGGKVRLAVEWNDNAVATYALNFPNTPIYHGDIKALSVDDCWRLSGLKPGELDILDGSPPCQGFSMEGNRMFNDSRNQLFQEFVRLLRGLKPKVFVMENVSGMVKGKMRLLFADCLKALKACGYKVKARILNAMYFDVPQSRQRLIFIGIREDLNLDPSHPKGQTVPKTVRQAFKGLSDDAADRATLPPDSMISRLMRAVRPGGECCVHFSKRRLHWQRPSNSLCTVSLDFWHPEEHRPLTRREIKRLQSFPDDYKFVGSVSQVFSRIGNSVPPNFMRAIAEHVRDNLLGNGVLSHG